MTETRGLRLEEIAILREERELMRVDATIAPGEVLCVMGPSGSGKSTLFSFVAGFLDTAFTASGRIVLDGREITAISPQNRRIGLLFQHALLFPHMSVGGNLLFALPAERRGASARRALAEAMLAEVGLAGFFARDPATLSGGEQARVALARTLLADPRALLLDEAFSRLDVPLRRSMRRLVFDSVRARAIPAILVTHDIADAEDAGGPILRIGDADLKP